jgi:REP element-mobilizing transposase RayT
MWNDTDVPLAYFITFRCYGTWLHGDERGSIDRHNNAYRSPKIPASPHWQEITQERTNHPPVYLNAARRSSVVKAIRETCKKRGWRLLAINVRTNHIHVVVEYCGKKSSIVLAAFKANATRYMRENDLWKQEHSPWAEKGSRRNLWNERSVYNAVDYVNNGQGDDLPDFDHD